MIIKRNLKSQMPSLKRCKPRCDSAAAAEVNDGGNNENNDDDSSISNLAALARRKKRKLNGGYYPLNLLGDVSASVIPVTLRGIIGGGSNDKGFAASWCTEVSCSPPEEEAEESESKPTPKDGCRDSPTEGGGVNRTAEFSRPPLVRTSRGRVQVLPSRFNDSVIENWRKDGKTSLRDYSFNDDDDEDDDYILQCDNKNSSRKDKKKEKDKFSFRRPKTCNDKAKKRGSGERLGYKCRKYATLCEEEEEDGGGETVGFNSFDLKKYSSERSTLSSLHEQLGEDEKFSIVDLSSLEVIERKVDGLYGPEDFYAGDIVWAKSGKKDPFWPAIVIDPMTQAPELVLRSCIPDAACVMFFGYAGNENQRV